MKLVEYLKAGIQPYTAHPEDVPERPVGFATSKIFIERNLEYFKNSYILLVKSPSLDGARIPNEIPIANLYCLERALCSFILANSCFLKKDTTKGLPILSEELYKVIVLQNGREPLEYDDKFTARLVKWLKISDWQQDYPSYLFLHRLLCKLGERFHGIPARLTSPKIAHTGYFISKHVRNPDDIHSKLQTYINSKLCENSFFTIFFLFSIKCFYKF